MNYIGKWKIHSIGEMGDDGIRYLSVEEYLASPMPYIDGSDAEAVAEEIAERKKIIGMELRVVEGGNLYMLIPIPDGVSREEVDAAVAAGEIALYDGMLCERPLKWEERDGELWFDTALEGETFGESADTWTKAIDENGYFNFMTLRFCKGE